MKAADRFSRMSRRELLQLAAFGATGTLLVPHRAAAQGKPTSQIRRGGILRDVQRFSVDSLDPHLSTARDLSAIPILYDTLLSYKLVDEKTERFEVGPGLAESYQVVDPTTVVFKLRRGVKFHDGSEFNAAVAKWNLERAGSHPKSKIKQSVDEVKQIQTPDPYTLRLTLKKPFPALPVQMTPANLLMVCMVSKEAVEKLGDDKFGMNPVGSGPMRFKEWVRDDRIVLEKFPGHWEKGEDGQPLPYVDGLVSRLITDQSVAFVELRSGNVDTYLELDLKDVATAKSAPNLFVRTIPGQWRAFPGFYFNPRPGTSHPFSNNKKLREAAQYAMDRESMAKALGFGLGRPAYYFFWYPGMLGYDESLPRREFDLARAKRLVQEAGFPNGVDVEVKVINRTIEVRSVEVMQAMLDKVGIRLKITPLDRLPWIDDGRAGRFQALSHSNSSRVDPQLTEDSKTGSTYNWAGYSSPEVDKLWSQAAGEYDNGKRADLYRRIQRILYEDAFHVLGFQYPLVAAASKRVHNLSTQHNFRYIWLE